RHPRSGCRPGGVPWRKREAGYGYRVRRPERSPTSADHLEIRRMRGLRSGMRAGEGVIEGAFELAGAVVGRLFSQDAFAGGETDPGEFGGGLGEMLDSFSGGAGDENLAVGFEELIEAVPGIRENRRGAGGGFKKAAGRAITHRGHDSAGNA